ncbi:RNA methyltransferase [Kaistia dalseonensis]|uniref:tRNA G18 (Ribose-2'-O)-methylase SpoU n=1 Tax=Kaistia dalseonensis TaxID=410840 RepID=A0ABU0H3S0_9HYPH|nr:RNA methyltransferase [Kaistia dalseonensis]MCX5494371.1 RNA methyltransferase [Kaistia dalseonensis]MDQ0436953.1 tRNA G18 (ribose-2'-O)-methylase SpoU [Kaistia dalseonensis]
MPTTTEITDPADPRIAAYRDVRERDLVGRDGHFIAEGEVVLRHLVQSPRHKPLSLLIDQRRIDGLADLLAQLAPDVPVYTAGQSVLDAITGFHIHRGILAHGMREAPRGAPALLGSLGSRALVVALMGISNHDNMGGIFRNAAAFGADAILLDSGCCDPFYRKAIRVSVGTALTVPFAQLAAGEDIVDVLATAGFTVIALSPGGETELSSLQRPDRVAMLLGTEGPGLPTPVMARTRTVRISMAAGVDSLNVATTSGIVLHALTRTT